MTLSLYLARRFLSTFTMVFAGFFAMLFLLDMIEEVRRHPQSSLNDLMGLALLHTPGSIYNILPLLMILAAIALFLRLARSSELVAIRAAGQSAMRTLAAPVLTALAVGLVAVALFNPIVAATSKRYEILSGAGGGDGEFSVGSDGLWLRQGGADGQWVIRAESSNPDGTELFNVSLLAFDSSGAPKIRIEAASAPPDQRHLDSDRRQGMEIGRRQQPRSRCPPFRYSGSGHPIDRRSDPQQHRRTRNRFDLEYACLHRRP